ncbi:putative endonuclease or glycosyl hydrolase [Raphanus sativus]|uniref:Uncharacterized protein LOC130506455 n=1 Tax=Raphanus sativus TaxID=3726 RepID=A0A9W3CZV6_RAPSA|nr:uncharacterized protein LOC130506455 [Raphanus sativus]KAJ4866907.1 putative endonuclease or glycosyl hydrolase [Raphanus sativus]
MSNPSDFHYPIRVYPTGNTVVFLDVDDFPIPKHLDPQTIRQKIKRALENRGYLGDVSVRLYGDKNTLPGKYSMDKYADAGIEICLVPEGEGVMYTGGTLMLMDSYQWSLNNPGESNLMLLSKKIKHVDVCGMPLLTFLNMNGSSVLLGEPLSEIRLPSESADWIWKSLSDCGTSCLQS